MNELHNYNSVQKIWGREKNSKIRCKVEYENGTSTCPPAGSPRRRWARRRPPGVRTARRRWTPCWTGSLCCHCCPWATAGHESDYTSHSTPWNSTAHTPQRHTLIFKHGCFFLCVSTSPTTLRALFYRSKLMV